MKYMILLSGAQRDYDAMAGKPAAGDLGWTGADFAALGAFMESLKRELADSAELVETRGLTAPTYSARRRQIALLVVALGFVMDLMDATVLTIRAGHARLTAFVLMNANVIDIAIRGLRSRDEHRRVAASPGPAADRAGVSR